MATTEDLLNLHGIGQRKTWYRFDILDRTLAKTGEVNPSGSPTVAFDTSRLIMRTMSGFTLPEDQGEDFAEVGVYVRPMMILENGAESPLGVFRFVDARRIRSDLGVTFEGTLSDPSVIVDVQCTSTVGLPADTLIEGAIRQALIDRGVPAYAIGTTGRRTGTPIAWPAGTSWLKIINQLSALMGSLPLYFDAAGTATIRAVPNLDSATPQIIYADGENIYETGIAEWNDILTTPNRFVVIDSGATVAPITATYDLPPSAPNSAYHIGYPNPTIINEQGLSDVTAALDRAKLAAFVQGAVTESVTFEGAPDWRHGAYTIIEFRGVNYLETSWSLPCTVDGPMSHSLVRIFT